MKPRSHLTEGDCKCNPSCALVVADRRAQRALVRFLEQHSRCDDFSVYVCCEPDPVVLGLECFECDKRWRLPRSWREAKERRGK